MQHKAAVKPYDRALPTLLYRALDAVMPCFRAVYGRFGLNESQWRVLRVLWDQGPCRLTDISRRTLIHAPSLVCVVDRLEAEGLVVRRRSAKDRRQVFVELTAAGAALEQQVEPLLEEAYAEIERLLPASKWTALYDAIDSLCAASSDRDYDYD